MNANDGLILVVDDNEMNRDMLSRRLERQGYRSLAAEDGMQAMGLLRAHNEIDLVLLDIMMPRMNGYQVLEQVKQDETLRHIPVIIISAVDDLDSVIKCIEMGAEDYLFKPFNPILLKARINASLEKKRLRDHERRFLTSGWLPAPIAERMQNGETTADTFPEVTALVARIGGLYERTPDEAAAMLGDLLTSFHALAAQHGLYGLEFPGAAYLAVGGAFIPLDNHAGAVSALARAMQEAVPPELTLQIGIHTGSVAGAVIQSAGLPRYALWGEAIEMADRLCLSASPGTTQISPVTSAYARQG
jgi:DNA-binding response OmpR family regulator